MMKQDEIMKMVHAICGTESTDCRGLNHLQIARQLLDVTQDTMDIIATYMDDDLREKVNDELAPCTPEEFLARYVQLDPEFEDVVLRGEFSIEL